MRFQAPRGTRDVLPKDASAWREVESAFREVARLYGFGEIRTPVFEDYDLFVRTSGETSDVVSKEMYDFEDKGGRHVALKPENTAPAMRAVLEHSLHASGLPLRLYYIAPIFRYGRPQKGRLRQHHQLGLELVGSGSTAADAEIIEMTVRFFSSVGIRDSLVLLNSMGNENCRAAYREVVLEHFASYIDKQSVETQEKIRSNPLRLVDSKDPDAISQKESLPPIADYWDAESKRHFEELQNLLTLAGVKFALAPEIVRGLDYYTGTVFEVQSEDLGAQSSLCGGGRYDHLIQDLGGPDIPAVGVGIGIERVILALESNRVESPDVALEYFVACATVGAAGEASQIARSLRSKGRSVVIGEPAKSLKSLLKEADRLDAQVCVILGDEELASGTATVRSMVDGVQTRVAIEDVGT